MLTLATIRFFFRVGSESEMVAKTIIIIMKYIYIRFFFVEFVNKEANECRDLINSV